MATTKILNQYNHIIIKKTVQKSTAEAGMKCVIVEGFFKRCQLSEYKIFFTKKLLKQYLNKN